MAKKTLFIDAHSHVTSKYYLEQHIDMILEQFDFNRVEFTILNGGHKEENKGVLELAKKYPDKIKPAIGIHPETITSKDDYKLILDLIDENVLAIGEIGLDYYYEDGPSREMQLINFEEQLKIAQERNLPVVIHIRDKEDSDLAYADAYETLKKYKVKAMLHTYAGTVEWAKKFIELDCYISFSGTITFSSNQQARDVIKIVPLNRILCETDAPYLRPHPYTGEKNEPNTIVYTTYYAAGVLDLGMEKFVARVNKNAKEFLGIK
ncbi:TatD family hydrolase [Mycoplasma sp. Ms02]|uniref:TatD family hydrolase n=1 Tax=Mycoplasma sp. Ms02 TaxID=353851 RepID=UPI002105EE65|nr:TatD family hydrolase [Mycoplasma sp. Ms02]